MGRILGQPNFNCRYYLVYKVTEDGDEQLVNSGTARELCEIYDITKSCISKAVNEHHLVRRRYKIYLDTTEEEEDEDK